MTTPEFRPRGQSPKHERSILLGSDEPSRQDNWRDQFPEIIGRGPAMLKVLETVSKVARTNGAVLISGESGTGKELIASAIHRLSPRSANSFVAINCSAIPEELLESELFGHEKGAFTGADRRRMGHFESANGGTIFLDEIGDMPNRLQAKLLRVLQEQKITPIGSSEERPVDVRVIAATNVNLDQAVAEQRFRLDLYYRLNVLPIDLPPLRERPHDIVQLLDHFLEIANGEHSLSDPCYFSREALERLVSYPWPGNIRELQNLVERLVVIRGAGTILSEHLPENVRRAPTKAAVEAPPLHEPLPKRAVPDPLRPKESPTNVPENFGMLPIDGIDLPNYVEELENSMILQALERTQNNKNQAARLLGLNRTTLVERIKKRNLAPLNSPSKGF